MSNTAAASGTASNSSLAILIGRVLLSILFILAGYSKLTDIAGTAYDCDFTIHEQGSSFTCSR